MWFLSSFTHGSTQQDVLLYKLMVTPINPLSKTRMAQRICPSVRCSSPQPDDAYSTTQCTNLDSFGGPFWLLIACTIEDPMGYN